MKLKQFTTTMALLVLGATVPALAHHSAAAAYKINEKVEIKGKVVQVLLRNPHSFIHVMAPDKSGKMQRWACEWGPGAVLARAGINENALKAGDEVVIGGHPGRNEADHRIGMTSLLRPSDGFSWKGLAE